MEEAQVWFADDVLIEFANDDPVVKNVWLQDCINNPDFGYTNDGEKSSIFVHRYNFAHLMHMLFLNCNNPEFNVIRADFNYAVPFSTQDGNYNTQLVTLQQVAR